MCLYFVDLFIIWIYLFISLLPHVVAQIGIIVIFWSFTFTGSWDLQIVDFLSAFVNRFTLTEHYQIQKSFVHA